MMARPARHPMIKNSMKRTKNIPNSILAIPAAAPAIPPNPRAAAIMEMTKKTAAQYSIDASFRQKSADRDFSLPCVSNENPFATRPLESQADAQPRPYRPRHSMRRTTKYAQRRPNEEARQQTQVFGNPLESVLNDLASVLVLFQNPVEFLDVGRFWKVVVETGLFEYCLVRPGSIAGNGD
jgi:hypothetical protein